MDKMAIYYYFLETPVYPPEKKYHHSNGDRYSDSLLKGMLKIAENREDYERAAEIKKVLERSV